MKEQKKKAECETCPIEETYAAMAVEDKLYLNWTSAANSIRKRVGQGNSERRILRLLLRCGEMERQELIAAAVTKAGDAAQALEKLCAQGLVEGEEKLTLTAAGEQSALALTEQQTEERRSYFSDLSSVEKEQLLTILEKMNNGWIGK